MAQYARLEVTLIALAGVVATAVVWHAFGFWALLPLVVAAALLAFYRDPERAVVRDERAILAPADGRVVAVEPDVEGRDGRRVLRIMIFLSVFNVHVNRSPCDGRVQAVQYRRGEFLNALAAEADTRNECNTLTLEPAPPLPGPVQVRQIAGVLARRIVCTARSGVALTAGERFGMIKLGSRTEVTLPADERWQVVVRVGEPVYAGLSVLARWSDAKAK